MNLKVTCYNGFRLYDNTTSWDRFVCSVRKYVAISTVLSLVGAIVSFKFPAVRMIAISAIRKDYACYM